MKRIIGLFLVLIMVFSAVNCFADDDVTLQVNGKVIETDVPPIIVNGRTMVPFRAIFEALDIPVMWNAENRKAYTIKPDATVILVENNDKMLVNGTMVTLEVAPFIYNDRMLIPARAVCESLQCTVDWDNDTRTVIIKTKDYVEPSYSETLGTNPEYIIKDQNFANDIYELINSERTSLGLSALTYDETLEEVAYYHSTDMADRNYLDHVSPDGTGLELRLDNAGIVYAAAGENLASGFTTAQAAFNAWKNSPSHYDNIINPLFTKVGLGYFAGGENGTYWTLVLIGE